MNEKIGIGRGITGDELEKQLQEELGETNSENIEDNEQTVEVTNESVEIKEEDKIEQELSSQIDNVEKKFDSVEKSIAEIGGEEVVKQVLGNMSEEEQSALQIKIEEQKKKIKEQLRVLKMGDNNSDIDGLWETTKILNSNPLSAVIGIPLFVTTGPLKGIQTLIRKIKLSVDKRKLKKMENSNK
ncbi:MAG: hypothetical protein WC011_01485 [Candidatus Paceibacterota bacterium]